MPESRLAKIRQLADPITAIWQLPRREFWREALTLTAVGMILVLVELLGRFNRLEMFDAGLVMVLLLTCAMVYSWHKRLRLRWTQQLQIGLRQVARYVHSWRFEWGLDLRQQPPIERSCPPLLRWLPTALATTALLSVAVTAFSSLSIGLVVSQISYVVYLLGLAALWSGMLVVILIAAFLPTWTLMDMVKSHSNWPQRKAARIGLLLTLAYFTLICAAALALPVWVATSLLAVLVAASVALPRVPGAWYPDCVWRNRAGCREVRSISLGDLFSLQLASVALLPLVCVLLALGSDAFFSAANSQSPVSSALGQATAWLASGGLLVFLGLLIGHLGIALWYDPSRRVATSLHISGVSEKQQQNEMRRRFARERTVVSFAPLEPKRGDVKIVVTDEPGPSEQSQSGVLETTIAELEQPTFRERIARRDVVQRRRMLMNGLQSIFRRAKSRKDRSGSGYWVAPQYWFVDGLTRDEFDDAETNVLDVIPPLYYKAFPRAARQHFFEITRALQIDLIYVEDSVDFRNLRRVLRVLFERYDIDGGRQPLADIHFAGLPKVRVMLHDYNFDEPPMKTKYPEPDYQHLGRVRILHVFRDRGEDEPQVETPEEPDWLFTPDDSPMLVG